MIYATNGSQKATKMRIAGFGKEKKIELSRNQTHRIKRELGRFDNNTLLIVDTPATGKAVYSVNYIKNDLSATFKKSNYYHFDDYAPNILN